MFDYLYILMIISCKITKKYQTDKFFHPPYATIFALFSYILYF